MNSSNTATPQATPLKNEHIQLGAKMVDFAGWYMPVEYFGIRAEHLHVREHVGLFDVSHMGEIRVQGENALSTLQWLTSNDVSKIENGQAQYGLLTNEKGGLVDDLIIYCLDKNKDYLVCVNAANTEKDWQWFQKHNKGAKLSNESSKWGQIAVQGPQAIALVADIFSPAVKDIEIFKFGVFKFSGVECLLARTGYTGEHGFEIFVPTDKTVELWRILLQKGEKYQARAIGLGARDTLRTEMKYSLYGQEIDDVTNPYEALLGWAVKPDAKDFVGRDNVMAVKSVGMKRKLIGFKMVDKGIARHDYKVVGIDKQEIGKVTSGTVSPSLNENIGIAYVSTDFSQIGKEIFIDIRGRLAKAVVVETPFVKSGLVKSKN